MNWQALVAMLKTSVPSGSVTTYAEVSNWAYGKPNLNHPVRSLLRGAANHGHQALTNRVVATSGNLADLPQGREQQLEQLKAERVPITSTGIVDFSKISPVKLMYQGEDQS
jgi:alkylated DNA nucleotide flippase Atl1